MYVNRANTFIVRLNTASLSMHSKRRGIAAVTSQDYIKWKFGCP